MSIGYTDLQHYSDIAAAIRSKSGAAATYTPAQMAAAIAAIPTGGGTLDLGYISGILIRNPTQSGPVDLTGLDTSGFNTLIQMFTSCSNMTSFDGTGWDTSGVTNMGNVFSYCSGMTSAAVAGWDTSHVTTMSGTFRGCTVLTSLDLSGWDTPSVANMSNMFYGDTHLESIYMPDWDTTSLTNATSMWQNCSALQAIVWSQKSTVQHIPAVTDWLPAGVTVYVPDGLVSAYQSDTNWSVYASQIAGISDLPQTYKTLYGIN